MNSFSILSSIYTCTASTTYFGNPSVLEEVIGMHKPGKSHKDVEGLELKNQKLSEIPGNLAEWFPNLVAVDFTSTEILTISSADLQPFAELVHLRVRKNKIVSLDGDLFQHNPNLQLIDFNENRLQNVGFNLFGELRHLKGAGFGSNPCINEEASNPQRIFELNQELPISCPPKETTTTELAETTTQIPEDCSLRCTLGDETDELKSEVAKVNEKLEAQDKIIAELRASNARLTYDTNGLKSNVVEQSLIISSHEQRFIELEKQMREIVAAPSCPHLPCFQNEI